MLIHTTPAPTLRGKNKQGSPAVEEVPPIHAQSKEGQRKTFKDKKNREKGYRHEIKVLAMPINCLTP